MSRSAGRAAGVRRRLRLRTLRSGDDEADGAGLWSCFKTMPASRPDAGNVRREGVGCAGSRVITVRVGDTEIEAEAV